MTKENKSESVDFFDCLKNKPYIVNIHNVSDEIVKNVEVFNKDFRNQSLLEYSYLGEDGLYETILNELYSLDEPTKQIVFLRYLVNCEDKKNTEAQFFCGFNILVDKNETKDYFKNHFTKEVNQTLILDIKIKDNRLPFYKETNLVLEFLMPKTHISLIFFPK